MDVRDELARITGLGYKVFPIVRKAKKPLTTNGLKDATTDMAVVDRWLGTHGDCNWAVAIPEEVVVVDVDTLDGGDANKWPRDQEQAASLMDCGAITLTPRLGRHLWFRQPKPGMWRNTAGKLAPKVDTRAEGGYVLIPPSGTRDGQYSWVEGMELDKPPEGLPYPPDWLVTKLNENPGRAPAKSSSDKSSLMPPAECILTFTKSTEVFVNTSGYWHRFALETLVRSGGQYSHTIDDVVYFTRPGRDPRDNYSAKWNHPAARHGVSISDGVRLGYPRLTVFTGNWPPFEAEQSYSSYDIIRLLTKDKAEWESIRRDMVTDHQAYWASVDPGNFMELAGAEHPPECKPHAEEEVSIDKVFVNPGDDLPNSFPAEFLETISGHKNSVISRVIEEIRKSEWMQQPLFRISGALALMATITGRKVTTKCGLLPNSYFLNVAPTGEGKDTARKVISKILYETEPVPRTLSLDGGALDVDAHELMLSQQTAMNLPHSDTATLRALEENPNRLAMVDEIGAILATAKKSPTSLIHRQLILLTGIFTHGRGPYSPPRYADSTKNFMVDTPCLSLFGFTVERSLGEAIDSAAVEGGLIPRCLMFRGLDEAPTCTGESGEINRELIEDIRKWRNWSPQIKDGAKLETPPYLVWGIDDAAEEFFSTQRPEWLKMKRYSQRTGEIDGLAYTRALELAKKLAILISADRIGPPPRESESLTQWENSAIINKDDAIAACAMVDFCMEEMARFVKNQTSDGPISRAANLIYSFLEKHRGKEVTKTQITRGVRQVDSKDLRSKAIELLIETSKISKAREGVYKVG
jgi:hypothetical protein